MIGSSRQIRVWVCTRPTSMHKSFDGLRAMAQQSLGREPLEGDLFLFVSRNRHQARVLWWDGTGLVVYAKRLEKNCFNAPWQGDPSKPWCLTQTELALFLEGSRLPGLFEVSPPPLFVTAR